MKEVEILFQELVACSKLQPDYRRIYRVMGGVFVRCLDLRTRSLRITLSSTFAKTDYLLKEMHASSYLRRTVNNARVRFRSARQFSNDDLEHYWRHDLKALCLFISQEPPLPSPRGGKLPSDRQKEQGAGASSLRGEALIPQSLRLLFPADEPIVSSGLLVGDCLRIVVDSWDDSYIYGRADNATDDTVRLSYVNELYSYDWHALQPLLKENTQLNIVRPRLKDGTIYPELLIFEPDYLVNISAIAACFEQYAHSPVVYLLNKLKPESMKSDLLVMSGMLGHMAGQLLDEEVFAEGLSPSYAQSAKTFFSSNALELLALGKEALAEFHFHQQAQEQKRNIHHIVGEALPETFRFFDRRRVILEPSFFSEMLGLQGRMDFLHDDQRLLIEQKSGKGNMDRPAAHLQHAVQMFLYMLLMRYNYREQYERNNRELHALLLYSRYAEGLVSLGEIHPQTVFEAIMMRNRIVHQEMLLADGGISRLIDSWHTADDLNELRVSGTLWRVYKKPEIDALLQVIHGATPLERAYFDRLFTFLAREQMLDKIGNQTTENSGFADKWNSSLEQKLQAGTIFANLTIVEPGPPHGEDRQRVDHVVLRFGDDLLDTSLSSHPAAGDFASSLLGVSDVSNFRQGDIVILYPYPEDEEPDCRRTMVFRGTLSRITTDSVTVSMKATQPDARLFYEGKEHCRWAIEHDYFEASSSALYGALFSFLCAPKQRRDLLLLQRRPQVDASQKLVGDYGAFNTLAQRVKQARDIFLIIGPPGTGKTSYGLVTTLTEELRDPTVSVLLMAYTNRAVDEICSKLVEQQLDFIRIGSRFSCEEPYRPYMLDEKANSCSNIDALEQLITRTRIFVGTTTSVSSHQRLFRLKQFSLAIIDEASQILEPHLLALFAATNEDGCCAIRKFVMIGDHKQLPAVVQQRREESKVDNPLLQQIGLDDCRHSLFERLLHAYRDDESVVFMLHRQGRMHQQVAMYPNEAYYQGMLDVVPLEHQMEPTPRKGRGEHGIDDLLATRRVAFVNVPAPDDSLSEKVNSEEARCIAAAVERIYAKERNAFSPLSTVGVIVPYRNQIAAVRKAIAAYHIDGLDTITIDTVERFQGSQRDYIIYGFTVQQYHQLDFLTENVFEEDGRLIDRKLNVAMTRAKRRLLMFGNAQLIDNHPVFLQLTDYLRRRQCFFSIAPDHFVSGRFTVPPSLI